MIVVLLGRSSPFIGPTLTRSSCILRFNGAQFRGGFSRARNRSASIWRARWRSASARRSLSLDGSLSARPKALIACLPQQRQVRKRCSADALNHSQATRQQSDAQALRAQRPSHASTTPALNANFPADFKLILEAVAVVRRKYPLLDSPKSVASYAIIPPLAEGYGSFTNVDAEGGGRGAAARLAPARGRQPLWCPGARRRWRYSGARNDASPWGERGKRARPPRGELGVSRLKPNNRVSGKSRNVFPVRKALWLLTDVCLFCCTPRPQVSIDTRPFPAPLVRRQ